MRRKDEKKARLTRYYNYADYGITKDQLLKLQECAKQKEYIKQVTESAYLAEPFLAEWLIKSAIQGRSYDSMSRGQIVPCGRTDFYGYQRRFYYILSLQINGTTSTPACDKIKESEDRKEC